MRVAPARWLAAAETFLEKADGKAREQIDYVKERTGLGRTDDEDGPREAAPISSAVAALLTPSEREELGHVTEELRPNDAEGATALDVGDISCTGGAGNEHESAAANSAVPSATASATAPDSMSERSGSLRAQQEWESLQQELQARCSYTRRNADGVGWLRVAHCISPVPPQRCSHSRHRC